MLFRYRTLEEKAGQMRGIAVASVNREDFKTQIRKEANSGGFINLGRDQKNIINYILRDYVYTQDPHYEYYQYPEIFIRTKIGDCDDVVIFLMSLFDFMEIPNMQVFYLFGGGGAHVFLSAEIAGITYIVDFANGQKSPTFKPTKEAIFQIPKNLNREMALMALQ